MRFLHLNHRYEPYVGGSERYMLEVSRMLSHTGHDVSVVTSDASDLEYFWDARRRSIEASRTETLDEVHIERVPVQHFPLSPFIFQGSRRLMGEFSRVPLPSGPFSAIARQLPRISGLGNAMTRRGPADLVHATNLGLEGIALKAANHARRLAVPFLFTPFIHLGSDDERVSRRYVSMPHQRKLLCSASHIVVMTHIEANFVISLGVPPSRLTVTGVGINPAEVTGGDSQRFRSKFGISGALVGTAGAVAFEKGSRDLVLAVSNLRARGHDVELFLAGPILAQFASWFDSLESQRKIGIHVPGFIDASDKRDMLAALDVLAMPSRTESFGIAYLEGWANRLPVLAARAGAVPELVVDEVNGKLVAFGDIREIEEKLLQLLASTAASERMGAAGHDMTLREFTWPRVLERVRGAYSAALGFELPEDHGKV